MVDSTSARISQLVSQIQSHPGRRIEANWKFLQRTIYAYGANQEDLLVHVMAPNQDSILGLQIMLPDQQEPHREDYLNEFFRVLHNYLASVATLIDHSRNFMHNYERTPFHFEYENRKTKLSNLEVASFLKDLRNYMLHRSAVPVSMRLQLARKAEGSGADFDFGLHMRSQELMPWDGWKSLSKSFLRKTEEIDIRQCIELYDAEIRTLYEWMFARFKVIHSKELGELDRLRADARVLMGSTEKSAPNEPAS